MKMPALAELLKTLWTLQMGIYGSDNCPFYGPWILDNNALLRTTTPHRAS